MYEEQKIEEEETITTASHRSSIRNYKSICIKHCSKANVHGSINGRVALAIIDNDVYTVWMHQRKMSTAWHLPTTTITITIAAATIRRRQIIRGPNGWYGNVIWGELPALYLIDDNRLKSRAPSHIFRIKTATSTSTPTMMMMTISPSSSPFLFKQFIAASLEIGILILV